MTEDVSKLVHFEELYTFWSGLCFKIMPKIKTKRNLENSLKLKFSNSMSYYDVPKVKMFFTSENNSYGIMDVSWFEGDEYSLLIDTKEKFHFNIDFKIVQYENLMSSTHCTRVVPFYKCVSSR